MLTFEGQKFQGPQQVRPRGNLHNDTLKAQWTVGYFKKKCALLFLQIMGKLTALGIQSCQHRVSSLDAQPSVGGGILVFVTGQLLTEGETNPLKFSQTFHLMPVGGSFVVTNGTSL